jgi:hypothetical protein
MKNVKGGVNSPPTCKAECALTQDCPVLSPYCQNAECTDDSGIHEILMCSPTQE